MGDKVLNIAASIVVLATISTVVVNGGNTATVIKSVGDLFQGSLATAMGNRR